MSLLWNGDDEPDDLSDVLVFLTAVAVCRALIAVLVVLWR